MPAGLTDPAIQFAAYADYAELNGLIDSATRDGIKRARPPSRFILLLLCCSSMAPVTHHTAFMLPSSSI